MPAATYTQSDFRGGSVSKSMQGRLDHPAYRTWMNFCVNSLPMEQGAWTRRPGTQFLQTTRGGLPGRVLTFNFQQSSPYTMEFTSGYLRFRSGPNLVTTNEIRTINSISSASPALVETTAAHGWSTGDQVMVRDFGANNPLLQNRMFTITVTSVLEFTIADALTGQDINGADIGPFISGNVVRILDVTTPYLGTMWSTVRSIQAEIPLLNSTTPGSILLHSQVAPHVLQVVTPQTPSSFATFELEPAVFKDGPYFDPVPGGTLATPSSLIGNVNVTLSFNAYDAARSYEEGDYVTSGGVNYRSLVSANLGSAPPSANWVAVSAGDAVGPDGFTQGDVGRLVRFYSEPEIWEVGTAYSTGDVVAYGGSGVRYDGAVTYWKALASSTGSPPGVDITKWTLFPSGAIWTWGKILSLLNEIDRALAGSVDFGDLVNGGGLAAAFDGNTNQTATAGAEKTTAGGATPGPIAFTGYVGKDYTGAAAQAIGQATLFPSNDIGLFRYFGDVGGFFGPLPFTVTVNLRASNTPPASASDGTLLATTGALANGAPQLSAPLTLVSSDQTTTWDYVWWEIDGLLSAPPGIGYDAQIAVAEVKFFNPPGSGTSTGVVVQILGDALLYTTAIRTWRLGLYSINTGWPLCGTYHEGRLWLSGTIANRIDSSKSNDIFNFAPTNPDGSVSGNNGITYTFNAPDINPIFWMVPNDLGILCGTQGGEWLVQATSQNLPLTPTTIQAHRYTKYNCANIEPRETDLTLAVVQIYKLELLEYFADVYSGRFSARDLAEPAKHLISGKIEEIAYQQQTIPVIWSRTGHGSLVGCTYRRQSLSSLMPSDFSGWHVHALGSNRQVDSICIGANTDGTLDALVMVTNDPDTGIRHVEMITNFFTETMVPANGWFLDSAVTPSSTVSSLTPSVGAPYGGMTINGLWHLEGETVQVTSSGLDCGQGEIGTDISDFVVTDGSVFVPYGDSISSGTAAGQFTPAQAAAAVAAGQLLVGLTYTSIGQIVRPNAQQEAGTRNGPAFGKLRRNQQYMVLADQTAGLEIGTTLEALDAVEFNPQGSGRPMTFGDTFSGVYRAPLADDDTFDGMVVWRVTRPWPATIMAIGAAIHTQDI